MPRDGRQQTQLSGDYRYYSTQSMKEITWQTKLVQIVTHMPTLCVRSVDMQKPLWAFHTLTVVSLDADITNRQHITSVLRVRTDGHGQDDTLCPMLKTSKLL